GCRLVVVEIAAEHAFGADEDLAIDIDADIDARQRAAHGMEAHMAAVLRRAQRAILSLTIELLQVEAERTEEQEGIFADCLAGGVAAPRAAEPELVLSRPVDQHFADRALQSLPRAGSLARQAPALAGDRHAH